MVVGFRVLSSWTTGEAPEAGRGYGRRMSPMRGPTNKKRSCTEIPGVRRKKTDGGCFFLGGEVKLERWTEFYRNHLKDKTSSKKPTFFFFASVFFSRFGRGWKVGCGTRWARDLSVSMLWHHWVKKPIRFQCSDTRCVPWDWKIYLLDLPENL